MSELAEQLQPAARRASGSSPWWSGSWSGRPERRRLPITARLNELGMSSMKMINLMLAIEVEFDIAIPQAEITPDNFDSIASVDALVRLLGRRRSR